MEAEAHRSTNGRGRNEDFLSSKNLLLGSLYYGEQRFDYYNDRSQLSREQHTYQYYHNSKITIDQQELRVVLQGPKTILQYSDAGIVY